MLSDAEKAKLKSAQLELMDELHRICVKNDIKYYMVGGTLLGARRHKGFIPWDVDMDISFLRDDYIKFKEACGRDLDSKYEYVDYKKVHNYMHPHALLCIRGTKLLTKCNLLNPNVPTHGIYIDLFAMDRITNDKKLMEKLEKKVKGIGLLKLRKIGYLYDTNWLKSFIKRVVAISLFFVNIDQLNQEEDLLMQTYNGTDSNLTCTMCGAYSFEKETKSLDILGTPQLYDFEGRKYYGPEKIDEYLKITYGDYMKLPPEEERKDYSNYFEVVEFNHK